MKREGAKVKDIAFAIGMSYDWTKRILKDVPSPINTRLVHKESDIKDVVKLRKKGLTYSEIARITGVSLSRIKRYMLKQRRPNEQI